MNKDFKFNNLLKNLGSLLYRFIIIVYAFFIVLWSDNYFSVYIYSLTLVVYPVLVFLYTGDTNLKAKARLFLDNVTIFIVLYNKEISIFNYTFLLIPIFNLPNFTSQKRSYLLTFSLTMISLFVLQKKISFIYLVPFLSLFLISFFEYYRTRSLNLYNELNNSVIGLYELKRSNGFKLNIYKDVISRLNHLPFKRLFITDNIIYLKLNASNYYVQDSSYFIANLEIKKADELKQMIKEKKPNEVLSNFEITIDGVLSDKNIIIPIRLNEEEYGIFILLITPTKHLVNYLQDIKDRYFLTPTIKPFFKELSVYIEIDFFFVKDRISKFEKIKGEYDYVLRTINAVHFIRNRLSPFKNYLEMISDQKNKESEISAEDDKMILALISSENQTAKTSLAEIVKRANQILDEGDNPFNVSNDIQAVKTEYLFSFIRNLSSDLLSKTNIKSNLSNKDFDRTVLISMKGMNIVISDLINNIAKHGNGDYLITFDKLPEEFLCIIFENNYPSIKEGNLSELIKYYTSKENHNIFKMKTKGAFLIKDFLGQMNIPFHIEIDKKLNLCRIVLQLKFES